MPGLALLVGSEASSSVLKACIAGMARSGYLSEELSSSPRLFALGCAKPLGYPTTIVRVGTAIAALDGAIYDCGNDVIGGKLSDFVSGPKTLAVRRPEIETWAAQRDGDFVLFLIRPEHHETLIVNDRLGRLPLYYACDASVAVVAREVKCVREVTGRGEPYRQAFAEILLFGFPLGYRTLHRHITRLPEASSLYIDLRTLRYDLRRYFTWNFEMLDVAASQSGGITPAELAMSFVSSCKAQANWASQRPKVLALSGGLDSRAVGAGLTKAAVSFDCITALNPNERSSPDVEVAKPIAAALGAPWRLYQLGPPTMNDIQALVALTDGLNNIAIAHAFTYFQMFIEDFGPNACHFSGDGGDKALPDLSLETSLASTDELVADKVRRSIFPLNVAAVLLGLSKESIVLEITKIFESYPETKPNHKNVRFLCAERGWGWLFGGEDRNRAFVWHLTPFYCQSFFEKAFGLPMRRKANYKAFTSFLQALDPVVARIENANWGYPLGSPQHRARKLTQSMQSIRKVLRSWMVSSPGAAAAPISLTSTPASPVEQYLLHNTPAELFSLPELTRILETGPPKASLDILATPLMYAAQVWGS